jgi:deoxyribodipyrimidine photo-lyase
MFTPTRAAARQRLLEFLPRAGEHYKQRRNFDHGTERHDSVSCLSPWIRHRLLLEGEVAQAAFECHGVAAGKFIDEVFWRTYFRGWMAHYPNVWVRYLRAVREARDTVDRDAGLAKRLQHAEAGDTGNAAFDHWARGLVTTGYLHNHSRMWFASIWVFTLRLPWVLGADFFLRHLLDGDPASNTLSWRWVCGLHTRGKIYLARRDNILRFTEGRLDPGPGLAQHAEPLWEPDAEGESQVTWPETPDSGDRNAWAPGNCSGHLAMHRWPIARRRGRVGSRVRPRRPAGRGGSR